MQPTTGNLVADTICRTAEIGLTITGAADAGTFTIIDAAPVAVEGHCPDCTQPGKLRDHTVRRLVDLPVVGFPTRLHVRAPPPIHLHQSTMSEENLPSLPQLRQ